MKTLPDRSFRQLTDLSFGFFGVQIAYALQSANISRIFATLGADPHSLSYFWILPPLMGIIVQPIIGSLSDITWTRFGRRIPYLFIGASVAIIVMCLLPNAGAFNFSVANAMLFGLVALMFLDTSINMAMQPFKMLVGDQVNEKQKSLAYSIQSFLCNAGSLVGYVFPFIFTAIGIANQAPEGQVPPSVVYSFYVGACILILCVLYTTFRVKEMPPEEYKLYHCSENTTFRVKEMPPEGNKTLTSRADEQYHCSENTKEEKSNVFVLLKNAPRAFWTVGLVQFFCWAAFMYMWTYITGSTAEKVWHTSDTASADYQEAGNWAGLLFAVQAIGSVIWATIIPRFKKLKIAYSTSLILGGIGFISTFFINNKFGLFISYALVGCAWAAMLALPFTLLTNALQGSSKMGTYLGLFNGTICLPQIVAALCGGTLLSIVGSQPMMLVVSGVLLFIGATAVINIKNT